MNKYLKLLISILLCSSVATIISCEKNDNSKAELESLKNEREKITGHVIYASPDWQAETGEKLATSFMELYPNVTVEVVPFTGDVNTFLSTQAATGNMPDLAKGFQELVFSMSQGWIAPLNEFVNDDEKEFQYVEPELLKTFVYEKNLYALPCEMTLSGVFVNLDLLEQLNLDAPDYDWTIDDLMDYARKTTDNTHSGISSWPEYNREMIGMFTENGAEYLYDPLKGGFDFTGNGLQKAFNFKKDMLSVPGMVASSLRNIKLKKEGKLDDYQKKFGKEGDGYLDGKIPFLIAGLWNLDTLNFNFNFDYYPLPHDSSVGYKQAVHIDHMFMTSMVKEENKRAAFEFMKWMTYGYEGNIAKFDLRKSSEDPKPRAFIPATTHPEVLEEYNDIDNIPNGVKYMYKNMDKSYRVDLYKVIPGMWYSINNFLAPAFKDIQDGKVEASSIAAELEKKSNDYLNEANEQLKKDMSQFDYYTPQELLHFMK